MKTLQILLAAVVAAVAAATDSSVGWGEAEVRTSCQRTETDPSVDGAAGTQLLNSLSTMSLAFLDGTRTDARHNCVKLVLRVDKGAYDYIYTDSAGTQKSRTGLMKFQKGTSRNLPTFIFTGLPAFALGSDASGIAQLHPKLVTPTELLLQSCRGWLIKTRRSYLFTSNDLESIDVNCATRKLKELYGIRAKAAPMNCGSRMDQFEDEEDQDVQ